MCKREEREKAEGKKGWKGKGKGEIKTTIKKERRRKEEGMRETGKRVYQEKGKRERKGNQKRK